MKEKIYDLFFRFSIRLVYSILIFYVIDNMKIMIENGWYIAINPFTMLIGTLFGIPGILLLIMVEMIG